MERCTAMYPHGQPGLLDDPVMAYVNDLHATGAASDSVTTRRPPTTWPRDPSYECYVCVVSTSSSSDPEPAPRHRATDAQRRTCLDTLAEARHQLDEELANLHQELGRTQSSATGSPHCCRPRSWSRCRSNPVRGTVSSRSTVLLLNNLEPAPRRRRLEGAHVTTTDAPMMVRTSIPTPTVMPRRSSGECRRTSPLQPCCCATAGRQRSPKKDECASSLRHCSK
jgi:hypothetical protein